jgi:hypothetical protein
MKIAQIVFAITAITCVVTIFNLAATGICTHFLHGRISASSTPLGFFWPLCLTTSKGQKNDGAHLVCYPPSPIEKRDRGPNRRIPGQAFKNAGAFSYGISAKLCKVGAKLASVAGSTCEGCYALKDNYNYPSVQKAHENRVASLSSVSWADAMIFQIRQSKTEYFRWHDSGDLQSLQHLFDIVRIAEALPSVKFWIPTREKGIVNQYLRTAGDFPDNLVVRVSAAMIDGDAPTGYDCTSTVHQNEAPIGSSAKPTKTKTNAEPVANVGTGQLKIFRIVSIKPHRGGSPVSPC